MVQVSDMEYLQRPIIEDVEYIITDNKIKIASPHTLYCNVERIERIIPLKELLELYQRIIKKAKEKKFSISYKARIKNTILANYDRYIKEIQESNLLFDKMIEIAKQVEKRKIHYGSVDDEVLNNLSDLKNEYIKIYYRASACSIMEDIKHKLDNIYSNVNSDVAFMKVFL